MNSQKLAFGETITYRFELFLPLPPTLRRQPLKLRRNGDRLLRCVKDLEVTVDRCRVRPRKRWRDYVMHVIEAIGLTCEMAKDHTVWNRYSQQQPLTGKWEKLVKAVL